MNQPTPQVDSDLMLAELLAHQGPPVDIVALLLGPGRDVSQIRAAMLTDLLAAGRAALRVEHHGFESRVVVELTDHRADVASAPGLNRVTPLRRNVGPSVNTSPWRR